MTDLVRFPDWPERLAAFLESRRESPKKWGYNDCGMFCADAIEVMTGVDMAEELRSYDSPCGALKALVAYLEHRGSPLPRWREQPDSLLCEVIRLRFQVFGCPPIQPCMAQRGDAVLLNVEGLLQETLPGAESLNWTRSLGIMGMNGFPVTAGLAGTVELPSERIVMAWRI